MGEPTGQEDSQEAPSNRALCALLTSGIHESSAQPVHEKAQQTAAHRQEQVVEVFTHLGGQNTSMHTFNGEERETLLQTREAGRVMLQEQQMGFQCVSKTFFF